MVLVFLKILNKMAITESDEVVAHICIYFVTCIAGPPNLWATSFWSDDVDKLDENDSKIYNVGNIIAGSSWLVLGALIFHQSGLPFKVSGQSTLRVESVHKYIQANSNSEDFV